MAAADTEDEDELVGRAVKYAIHFAEIMGRVFGLHRSIEGTQDSGVELVLKRGVCQRSRHHAYPSGIWRHTDR